MIKDFDAWSKEKKRVHASEKDYTFFSTNARFGGAP